jgi:hypothetical protein
MEGNVCCFDGKKKRENNCLKRFEDERGCCKNVMGLCLDVLMT